MLDKFVSLVTEYLNRVCVHIPLATEVKEETIGQKVVHPLKSVI